MFFALHRQKKHEQFPRLSDARSRTVGISEICCECESYPANPGFACSLNCLDELGHSDHGNILSLCRMAFKQRFVTSSHHHSIYGYLWCLAISCHKSAHVISIHGSRPSKVEGALAIAEQDKSLRKNNEKVGVGVDPWCLWIGLLNCNDLLLCRYVLLLCPILYCDSCITIVLISIIFSDKKASNFADGQVIL